MSELSNKMSHPTSLNIEKWHRPKPLLLANGKSIVPKHSSFVVGILNCNEDSFYKESRTQLAEKAASIAIAFEKAGADILDLGAESTRPGSFHIDEKEELKRLIPVLKAIRKVSSIPISIDTRKASVFSVAVDEGADILNDVSSLQDDKELARLASRLKVPVILTHNRPKNNGKHSISSIKGELLQLAHNAETFGIESEKIILDPGIGFNKDFVENLETIKNISELCETKYRIMMALSRKRFIGEALSREVEDRLTGTVVADLFSVFSGVEFLRVHDVEQTVDSLKMIELLTGFCEKKSKKLV